MRQVKPKLSPKVSILILTYNAAVTLPATLESAGWADEVVIVDENSTDTTVDIALKFTDKILTTEETNFAKKREMARLTATSPWLFYVDSDEIITPELQAEIRLVTGTHEEGVFTVTRENYFLGKRMYPDRVERLFHRDSLRGWTGKVHESPVITCTPQLLTHALIHRTHTDITSMLTKTNRWSETEVQLRLEANHPPVHWWRLVRIGMTEGWHQFGQLRVQKFGRAGVFEGVFQVIDKLIVYTKLWEKQHAKRTPADL